jgi:hypothetical protein
LRRRRMPRSLLSANFWYNRNYLSSYKVSQLKFSIWSHVGIILDKNVFFFISFLFFVKFFLFLRFINSLLDLSFSKLLPFSYVLPFLYKTCLFSYLLFVHFFQLFINFVFWKKICFTIKIEARPGFSQLLQFSVFLPKNLILTNHSTFSKYF